jgi:mannose/fructose/N-acetylgalactosamine-specific phosphotransferase system component IIC
VLKLGRGKFCKMVKLTTTARLLVVVLVAIAAADEVVNIMSPSWIATVGSLVIGMEVITGFLLLVSLLLNTELLNRLTSLFLGILVADVLLYPISILPINLLISEQPDYYKIVPSDPSLIGLSRYYLISLSIAILISLRIIEKRSNQH